MAINLNTITRICNIIIGVLLLALGIVRFAYAGELYFIQVLLTVYYILFAIIFVLAEFEISIIINLFNFLESLCGKGFFLVFVGVLCFDVVHGLGRPFEKMDLAVGIIVCAYAILLIVLGFMNRDGASSTKPVEPKTVAPAKI